MQWNDSINNEGDLSCSSHNLHFKAHKDTNTQTEESRHESPLTPLFTELPRSQPRRHTLARKLAHHLLTRTLLFCTLMPSQPQPLPFSAIPRRNR